MLCGDDLRGLHLNRRTASDRVSVCQPRGARTDSHRAPVRERSCPAWQTIGMLFWVNHWFHTHFHSSIIDYLTIDSQFLFSVNRSCFWILSLVLSFSNPVCFHTNLSTVNSCSTVPRLLGYAMRLHFILGNTHQSLIRSPQPITESWDWCLQKIFPL